MITIANERLRERAREKVMGLELAVTQTAFADTQAELEEELELARIALASLEADPVAWRYRHHNGLATSNWRFVDSEDECNMAPNYQRQALYAAPPAPVAVPDNVSGPLAHAYKELTPTFMRNHIDVFERYGIYPDGSAGIQAMRIALDGMNRRAAMLQGAEPVSNLDELPDGWVACSERMPEDTQMVLAFNHGEIVAAYWNYVMCPIEYKKYRAFTDLSGSLLEGVTHWMPMPAAPQQEA
ncbi:DUF551 domain-containing protein [Enterobacter hormaechei]|uniref:DUF551 domain-containing protein n=1 Tax=Enterobacter hormaechei TaxID=158836 RepID=UPI003D6E0641